MENSAEYTTNLLLLIGVTIAPLLRIAACLMLPTKIKMTQSRWLGFVLFLIFSLLQSYLILTYLGTPIANLALLIIVPTSLTSLILGYKLNSILKILLLIAGILEMAYIILNLNLIISIAKNILYCKKYIIVSYK